MAAAIAGLALSGPGPTSASAGGPHQALTATTGGAVRPACHPAAPARPVVAVPVAGVPTDWTVTSFDGTQIRAHWFPVSADGPAVHPTVLMGPGWGQTGETDPTGTALFGGLTIDTLRHAGFNVLTWDPRGFGKSTGTVELDRAAYEARDVEQLINWVATRPGVELQGPDDPAIGMVGASYGGGIQFTAAAVDCRIDAIVPTIAWHSLVTSLDKNGTIKAGWAGILIGVGGAMRLDPRLVAADRAVGTGVLDPAEVRWFASAGPGDLVSRITAPTLIIQGTVDDLFTLDEGVTNFEALRARGVPTSMIWFCGGHGICLTPPGDQQVIADATLAWLHKYVGGEVGVATGPRFRFVDQRGSAYQAAGYPLPAGRPLEATGTGALALRAGGGSGPAQVPAGTTDPVAVIAAPAAPALAAHAVDVPIGSGRRAAVVVGPPELTLTYQGVAGSGTGPTRVFAQLVDDSTGLVLGNQVTPVDVVLDGRHHTTSVPLETVVAALHPGARLTLQLVATTVAYATPRLGGHVAFDRIHLSLPVAAGLSPH